MLWPGTLIGAAAGWALASIPGAMLGGLLGQVLDRRLRLQSWRDLLGQLGGEEPLADEELLFLALGRLAKSRGRVTDEHIRQARAEMLRLRLDETALAIDRDDDRVDRQRVVAVPEARILRRGREQHRGDAESAPAEKDQRERDIDRNRQARLKCEQGGNAGHAGGAPCERIAAGRGAGRQPGLVRAKIKGGSAGDRELGFAVNELAQVLHGRNPYPVAHVRMLPQLRDQEARRQVPGCRRVPRKHGTRRASGPLAATIECKPL